MQGSCRRAIRFDLRLATDVRVEIWTTTKFPAHAMILFADDVDYIEATGEISARDVRLTVQEANVEVH